jgi:cellulose 1,4-beta-cellobiosidase
VQKYKTDYIDKIADAFAAHSRQRIIAIVEPDSLANIATNLSIAKCAQSETAYRESVAYAISKLAQPHTFLYLDAAHAGWLGWTTNTTKIATIFQQVLMAAGGPDKVRGFATNVANYTVLNETMEKFDYMGNPCHDELTYVQNLTAALAAVGISNKGFVIDTSRNGKGGIRSQWGSWCNVKGAAMGVRPVADPKPGIDAYYWIKPPGESDGTSDSSAPRFDPSCTNSDATLGAPQAGQWFDSYFDQLALNATPPL